MSTGVTICEDTYRDGYREGARCPYRATFIVKPKLGRPNIVCGYHARSYVPEALYPLDWNLARIRAWQLDNLERVTRER